MTFTLETGFVQVMENLESHGMQEFPGLESLGILFSVIESHGNLIFCLLR